MATWSGSFVAVTTFNTINTNTPAECCIVYVNINTFLGIILRNGVYTLFFRGSMLYLSLDRKRMECSLCKGCNCTFYETCNELIVSILTK
jgi:hypothetical protein